MPKTRSPRVEIARLEIERELHDFMRDEAQPYTGIGTSASWSSFSATVDDLSPRNHEFH
ncbi:hypothetical protein [Mesorhizobium sp. B4-1-4]|uniref:hypothetical protein n=1 Tax=Mesorhizobium sp. B4-1-4 TaxID=2589888 RepID=UPI0015E299A8|nr:hypothetical protein [Mesorhizobium sp. B4-1-4]UCI31890.1 hypothetical protein FJW03_29855 [Mesorhizobium sp. B4-1-4]